MELDSNAQSWKLKVVCKNREYQKDVINAINKSGCINYKCQCIGGYFNSNEVWEGSYIVTMQSSWFHHLQVISSRLATIEIKHEELC